MFVVIYSLFYLYLAQKFKYLNLKIFLIIFLVISLICLIIPIFYLGFRFLRVFNFSLNSRFSSFFDLLMAFNIDFFNFNYLGVNSSCNNLDPRIRYMERARSSSISKGGNRRSELTPKQSKLLHISKLHNNNIFMNSLLPHILSHTELKHKSCLENTPIAGFSWLAHYYTPLAHNFAPSIGHKITIVKTSFDGEIFSAYVQEYSYYGAYGTVIKT